jgi:hypothetical protein
VTHSFQPRQRPERLLPMWMFLLRQDVKFTRFDLRSLVRRNERSARAAVAPGGPVVSLTTHGQRIDSVYLTLESIARGSLLPSRIILWLHNLQALIKRPDSLRRLEDRGIEVRFTQDYGPHTKYYPYLESMERFEAPLVLADDDVLYPRTWLSGLATSFRANSETVSCYRAHVVGLSHREVSPYLTWRPCRSTAPSPRHFATGVSGCIYPPALLGKVKAAGVGFLETCPRADDIWLHVNTVRAGFRIKQIDTRPLVFPFVPGTQTNCLSISNVKLLQNDRQIIKTYSAADIDLLLSEGPEHADGVESDCAMRMKCIPGEELSISVKSRRLEESIADGTQEY